MAVQSQVKSSISPEKRAVYAAHPDRIIWLTGLCGDLDFRHWVERKTSAVLARCRASWKILAFVSPFRAARDSVRAGLPAGKFTEVYVST